MLGSRHTTYCLVQCLALRPPIAEWQDGFSIRADGTGGGRNGLREDVDCFPFASTGLTSFCASSVWWLIPSSHGSLALLSVLAVVPFPLPTVFLVPFHFSPRPDISHRISNLLSHRHSCDKGIIFLRSYLGAAKLQVVSCEQSSFCAKEYWIICSCSAKWKQAFFCSRLLALSIFLFL